MDRSRPAPAPGELHTLSEAECRGLLADASTGRVAVVAPDGPHIVPVSYALVDESIVLRTNPYTVLARHADGAAVAFEVDHTDAVRRTGWSVVARGVASYVYDAAELAHIARVWEPVPWASGERNLHIRVRIAELSGRSVGVLERSASPYADRPVS